MMSIPRRMYLWRLLLLALAAAGEGRVHGGDPVDHLPTGFQQCVYREDRQEYKYLVYVPSEAPPEKNWPVVLFLHGAGEKGTDGLRPISVGLGTSLEQDPTSKFIAVFPQCDDVEGRNLTGWQAETAAAVRALKILDEVERNFPIDSNRRVLCGWSMGGYGAWSLAAERPELWSSVVVVSGGAVDKHLPLEALAAAKTPVWAIHGRQDPLIPYAQSATLIRRLNDVGGRGTLSILDEAAHDVWRIVFAASGTFEWMLDPASVDPEALDWECVDPLPPRSAFATEHLIRYRRIGDIVALRLGNPALQTISREIPGIIPQEVREGALPDVERDFGEGEARFHVRLSDIRFRLSVEQIQLRAISGGRVQTRFGLKPLTLSIGRASLSSGEHSARFENLTILIGHRRPVVLETEVQPVADRSQALRLILLRKRFRIEDDNWYIRPPERVEVESPTFTREQVVAGIVGALYLRRQEVEEQVLEVVSPLMEIVEAELSSRSAPRLARLLWPLPVLVPEIKILPAQIRCDPSGLSLLFDVDAVVRREGEMIAPAPALRIEDLDRSERVWLALSLSSTRAISQMAIDDGMAYINVLDLPYEGFAQLADPRVMAGVLPELEERPEPLALRAVLRLIEPFQMEPPLQEEGDGRVHLTLTAPSVAVDFSEQGTDGQWRELVRFVVAIHQPVEILTQRHPTESDTPGIQALTVRWNPDSAVHFRQLRSLGGTSVPRADVEKFEKLLTEIWQDWAQEQRPQTTRIDDIEFGSAGVSLDRFLIENGRAEFRFDIIAGHDRRSASPADPAEPE